jgi:hypothetical protein
VEEEDEETAALGGGEPKLQTAQFANTFAKKP